MWYWLPLRSTTLLVPQLFHGDGGGPGQWMALSHKTAQLHGVERMGLEDAGVHIPGQSDGQLQLLIHQKLAGFPGALLPELQGDFRVRLAEAGEDGWEKEAADHGRDAQKHVVFPVGEVVQGGLCVVHFF